jgi:hypothetical protein
VHLDERPRAGALVQAVDVLRDHRVHPAAVLELRERAVAVVRLGASEQREPLAVEIPHLRGVGEERVDRRVFERVVLCPDTARRAKVRNAGLGADARTGQHDARPASLQQFRETLDTHQ